VTKESTSINEALPRKIVARQLLQEAERKHLTGEREWLPWTTDALKNYVR